MTRIAVSLYSKYDGGLEESFVFYCNLLDELGYEITAFFPKSAPYQWRLSKKIETIFIEPSGYLDIYSMVKLILINTSKKYDVFMSFNSRAGHYSTIISKLTKSRSIAYTASYKVRRLKGADAIICVTDIMRKNLEEKGFNKDILYTLPPVSIELSNKKFSIRRTHNIYTNIGYLGRMTQEKGFKNFCNAITEFNSKSKLNVHIAGDGPEKEQGIVKLKKYNVSMNDYGWIEDKDYFFSKIDILVVPSTSETFGIVILEAIQRGVLVVSTPTDGAFTILSHNKDGWISDSFSPSSIAQALGTALANRKKWDEIRQNALHKLELFGIEATKEKMNTILERVLLR
jgi:glycosyltransferase involved in cell wall biosynthesis